MTGLQIHENPTKETLIEYLSQFDDFETFFVKTCELKNAFDGHKLKILAKAVNAFSSRFNTRTIVYLSDCIHCEMAIPCKNHNANKTGGENK